METLAWALLAFVIGYAAGIRRGRKIERRQLIHKAARRVADTIAKQPSRFQFAPPVDYPKPSKERTH